jgi:anionic cell wall polymer biosynthesis LytR-Cps2A-Psr (LCP) family protein
MRPFSVVLAGVVALLVVVAGNAATLNVPSASYPTIQSAINAAVTGNLVVVATGTYPENIDFLGKDITVQSTDPLDPAVVSETTMTGRAWGR